MKVRILSTGEIVDVEYDDDDLYKVLGRHLYLYASEFEVLEEDTDPHIPLSTVRSVLEKLVAEGDIEPVHISVDGIINRITQYR